VSDPDARALVEKMVEMKRRHLETLKGMAAALPQVATRR
jgi:rubrerythrin